MRSKALRCLIICTLVLSILLNLPAQTAGALGTLPPKNTAARHIVCTALSDQAVNYYGEAFSYDDVLSRLPGAKDISTSDAAMRNNTLFNNLHMLMADTHTYSCTYSGYKSGSLAYFWASTDAAAGSDSYIMFYSDIIATDGIQLNREHIWPKSRASFNITGGGADLHHLRPSVDSVNAAKSDHLFGYINGTYQSGYTEGGIDSTVLYYVNRDDDLFECKDDVKGDVARILLYTYCRWEQPNLYSAVSSEDLPPFDADDTANSGAPVIESLDTLLLWCALAPVDTWEMERNDLIEEIQGNRNVFIDYPELAWQLFGKEPPTHMATPTHAGCEHRFEEISRTDADCTADGSFTLRCSICGDSYTRRLAAIGHSDENDDDFCDRCRKELTVPAPITRANTLHNGDHLVLYHPSTKTTIGTKSDGKGSLKAVSATITDGELHPTGDTAVMVVSYVDNERFYLRHNGYYLTAGATGGSLNWTQNANDYSLWRLTPYDNSGTFHIDSVYARHSDTLQRLGILSGSATVKNASSTPAYRFELYTTDEHYYDEGVTDPDSGVTTFTCRLCGETLEEHLPLLGDVDGDGNIMITDVTFIQRKLAGIPIPFDLDIATGDTDSDHELTVVDATLIQNWLASVPSDHGIGRPLKKQHNDKAVLQQLSFSISA